MESRLRASACAAAKCQGGTLAPASPPSATLSTAFLPLADPPRRPTYHPATFVHRLLLSVRLLSLKARHRRRRRQVPLPRCPAGSPSLPFQKSPRQCRCEVPSLGILAAALLHWIFKRLTVIMDLTAKKQRVGTSIRARLAAFSRSFLLWRLCRND